MTKESPEPRLAEEFDLLIARAGLTIPEDRRAELLAIFADLRAETERLHATLPADLEPASVFRAGISA